ncbi:MAG: radical SAM protein [Candidatus Marinimicrobia bacterium]|nr:radical SAM protein [Candidatus Neomarinimicrobiota bacterium]
MPHKILVIEPPFIEPGIPYPDIHRITKVLQNHGALANAFDINARLYRQVLNHISTEDNSDLLIDCLKKSFFIDEAHESNNSIVRNSFQHENGKNNTKFGKLLSQSLSLFSGNSINVDHNHYVNSQECLNGFLDYMVKKTDPNSTLWLNHYENEVNFHRSQDVLEYAQNPNNGLRRLYKTYLSSDVSKLDYDFVLIVIRNQTQQLPGMVLSAWLKDEYDYHITLTGEHLDKILSLSCPSGIFDICDEIIAYKIDYSADFWLMDAKHPFIINDGSVDYPEFSPSVKNVTILPGIIPLVDTSEYITPFPVMGASVSYRCYWSNCSFCSLADEKKYPSRRLKDEEIYNGLISLKNNGISHIQFMDYALPPALIKNFMNLKDLDIYWAAQLRFENTFSAGNIFSDLFDGGCTLLSWGFESGSRNVLDSINKGGILNQVKRAEILKKSADSGILNHLFVIAGLPGETESDFIETVNFINNNQDYIHGLEVYPYQFTPHTLFFNTLEKNRDMNSNKEDWSLDVPFRGPSETELIEERAQSIQKTFGFINERSKTNDFIEGHLTLKRSHFNTSNIHEVAI